VGKAVAVWHEGNSLLNFSMFGSFLVWKIFFSKYALRSWKSPIFGEFRVRMKIEYPHFCPRSNSPLENCSLLPFQLFNPLGQRIEES